MIDLGGNVIEYMDIADHWTKPVAGVCASACTMKLRHAECVAPDAVLMFHESTSPVATYWMTLYYNRALRRWFNAGVGDRWVRGSDLARFGYRMC